MHRRGRMMRTFRRPLVISVLSLSRVVGATGLRAQTGRAGSQPAQPPAPADKPTQTPVKAGSEVNKADVDFMSGMIPHHAQAVIMAGWAPSHGAREDVRILC